jgi:hypothetical protein
MKPTETAKQLLKRFGGSKTNALICVHEIKKALNNPAHGAAWELEVLIKKEEFWQKVHEIITHKNI